MMHLWIPVHHIVSPTWARMMTHIVPPAFISYIPGCWRGIVIILAWSAYLHRFCYRLSQLPWIARSTVQSIGDTLFPEWMSKGAPDFYRVMPREGRNLVRKVCNEYNTHQELVERFGQLRLRFSPTEISNLQAFFHGPPPKDPNYEDGVTIARRDGWGVYRDRVCDHPLGRMYRLLVFHYLFPLCFLWLVFVFWPVLDITQRTYYNFIVLKVGIYMIACLIFACMKPWFLATDPFILLTSGTRSGFLTLLTVVLSPEAYPLVEVFAEFGRLPRQLYIMMLSFTDIVGFIQVASLIMARPVIDGSGPWPLIGLTFMFSLSLPMGLLLMLCGDRSVCTLREKKYEVCHDMLSCLCGILMTLALWYEIQGYRFHSDLLLFCLAVLVLCNVYFSVGPCLQARCRNRLLGQSAHELQRLGFALQTLREAGFTLGDIDQGSNARELREAGFSAQELRTSGWPQWRLREAGYTWQELRSAGFVAADA